MFPFFIKLFGSQIEEFSSEIPTDMLQRVDQNWTCHIKHLRRSLVQHLHEIIYKQWIIHIVLSTQANISQIYINLSCFFIKFEISQKSYPLLNINFFCVIHYLFGHIVPTVFRNGLCQLFLNDFWAVYRLYIIFKTKLFPPRMRLYL